MGPRGYIGKLPINRLNGGDMLVPGPWAIAHWSRALGPGPLVPGPGPWAHVEPVGACFCPLGGLRGPGGACWGHFTAKGAHVEPVDGKIHPKRVP